MTKNAGIASSSKINSTPTTIQCHHSMSTVVTLQHLWEKSPPGM